MTVPILARRRNYGNLAISWTRWEGSGWSVPVWSWGSSEQEGTYHFLLSFKHLNMLDILLVFDIPYYLSRLSPFVGASFSVTSWESAWDLTCLKMSLFCLHTRLLAGSRILGWKYFSSEFQRHCTDVLHVSVWLLRSLKAFWFLVFVRDLFLTYFFVPCDVKFQDVLQCGSVFNYPTTWWVLRIRKLMWLSSRWF